MQPGQGLHGNEVPAVADAIQVSPRLCSKEGAGRSNRNLCFNISVCVCECGCVSVCVCRTTIYRASAPGLCPCSRLILAANTGPSPWWAGPAPGTPAGGGLSLVRCGHFGVPGAGWGATQLSSSLQCQEEDGHGPPEPWAGLARDSTAGHHHHFIGIHLLPGTFSLLQCDIVYGNIPQVA